MSEKTKKEIYEYLQKYIHQKQEHSDYIDYYELYDIDPNLKVDAIRKEMKQKEKYLHPDQIAFVDEEFKNTFRECSNLFIKAKGVFSSEREKENYDHKLKEKKDKTNNEENNAEKFGGMDSKKLESAIETTIYKYGFYQGYMALQNAARNEFSYITSENGARKKAQELGGNKIKEIIYQNRKNIMENNTDNLTMDYFCNLIEKRGLYEKASSFYDACYQTVRKYDLLRNDDHTVYAIDLYMKTGEATGFTNRNGVRDNFKNNNLHPLDINILMCAKLHKYGDEDPKYLFSNTFRISDEEKAKLFIPKIKEEVVKMNKSSKTV